MDPAWSFGGYINILYKTLQFHLPPMFILSDIALYIATAA